MAFESPDKFLPCVSIDCTVFGFAATKLQILLIARKAEPGKGKWSLPGGLIGESEDIDDAAYRILESHTRIRNIYMDQIQAFGQVNRFPGKRIITIGYTALVKPENYPLTPGPSAEDVKWFDVAEIPQLAFDHDEILKKSLTHLKLKVQQQPIGFELLPHKFTMPEIQSLYQAILGKDLDRRNFRKKLLKMKTIQKLEEKRITNGKRPVQLYRFDKEVYEQLQHKKKVYDFSRL